MKHHFDNSGLVSLIFIKNNSNTESGYPIFCGQIPTTSGSPDWVIWYPHMAYNPVSPIFQDALKMALAENDRPMQAKCLCCFADIYRRRNDVQVRRSLWITYTGIYMP